MEFEKNIPASAKLIEQLDAAFAKERKAYEQNIEVMRELEAAAENGQHASAVD